MKTLTISPQSGLGNRLRAIASAIVIGQILDRKVYHCWLSSEQNAPSVHVKNMQKLNFTDLFEESSEIELAPSNLNIKVCFSEWLPGDFWHDKQSSGQKMFNILNVKSINSEDILNCEEDNILIETSRMIILPGYNLNVWKNKMRNAYKKLIPKLKYQELVPDIHIDVTVAIRRGDFLWYFPEANQNSLDIAYWLKNQIEEKSNILIISDDKPFRNEVINLLKDMINVNNKILIEDIMNYKDLTDWEIAFVEFLTMASSDKIYGTPLSSFSEEAAIFGNKLYKPILSS